MEDAKIDDPKVIAAIATAVVALAVGLLNLAFNIFTHFASRRHDKSLEVLKAELERSNIAFKNMQESTNSKRSERKETIFQVLEKLQEIKDACYLALPTLDQDDNQYYNSLLSLNEVFFSLPKIYQSAYMKMDEREKNLVHNLKAVLQEWGSYVDNQLLRYDKRKTFEKRIPSEVLKSIVESISEIQKTLLDK